MDNGFPGVAVTLRGRMWQNPGHDAHAPNVHDPAPGLLRVRVLSPLTYRSVPA